MPEIELLRVTTPGNTEFAETNGMSRPGRLRAALLRETSD